MTDYLLTALMLAGLCWIVVLALETWSLRRRVDRMERIVGSDVPGDGLWWHIGHLRKAVFGRPGRDSDPSRIDKLEDRVGELEEP